MQIKLEAGYLFFSVAFIIKSLKELGEQLLVYSGMGLLKSRKYLRLYTLKTKKLL